MERMKRERATEISNDEDAKEDRRSKVKYAKVEKEKGLPKSRKKKMRKRIALKSKMVKWENENHI
jgi:peptidoglycan hydrolase-like amidase